MKIAIYGAGSLGTIIGAYLSKAGVEVDLINRNKSHVNALKSNGARISGTVNIQVPVNALLPEEMSTTYDIIFLLTKQLDNKKVIEKLVPFLEENGVICTAQNGIPELSVAEIIGNERAFGCAIEWGATMKENGECELTSHPDRLTFSIGSLSTKNKNKLDEIKSILENVGPVKCETNFIGVRWSKLLVNSAFSGMSAVLGCTFGEAAKHKNSRRCIQKIMKECLDVAAKSDVKIEPIQGKNIRKLINYNNGVKRKFVFLILPLLIKKHALLKASMLQDLEKGKPTEVDAINGIISKYGRIHKLATPYNDKVIEIIHKIESGKCIPCFENLALFDSKK